MKLTKQDIKKYATKAERKLLEQGPGDFESKRFSDMDDTPAGKGFAAARRDNAETKESTIDTVRHALWNILETNRIRHNDPIWEILYSAIAELGELEYKGG